MAARLDMTVEAFEVRFVRTVPDPVDGKLRTSLVEEGGRCALLEDGNHCSVYEDRPRHCATFPFWERVLTDPDAFERARSVCPGIAVEVPADLRARAFAKLEVLYAELEAEIAAIEPRCELSGRCCRFDEFGHELFATGLEADYALHRAPELPEPTGEGRCPYHQEGRCTNREGRALGCRSFYCDEDKATALEDLHARFLDKVRALERSMAYPVSYGRFPALLAARGKTLPSGASDDPES